MTFPVVASKSTVSKNTTDVTTHNYTVPASIASGDLLMLFLVIDGNTVTQPTITGFTNLLFRNGSGALTIAIYYKVATGGEAGGTFTTSVAEQSIMQMWRITGAASPPEMVDLGTNTAGVSTANPGAMTPSWGSADTLFGEFAAIDGGRLISAYSTNYTDNQVTDNTGTGTTGAGLGLASRTLTGSTDDADAMTVDGTGVVIARAFAVQPGSAGTGTVVDPMGMSGFYGA